MAAEAAAPSLRSLFQLAPGAPHPPGGVAAYPPGPAATKIVKYINCKIDVFFKSFCPSVLVRSVAFIVSRTHREAVARIERVFRSHI